VVMTKTALELMFADCEFAANHVESEVQSTEPEVEPPIELFKPAKTLDSSERLKTLAAPDEPRRSEAGSAELLADARRMDAQSPSVRAGLNAVADPGITAVVAAFAEALSEIQGLRSQIVEMYNSPRPARQEIAEWEADREAARQAAARDAQTIFR